MSESFLSSHIPCPLCVKLSEFHTAERHGLWELDDGDVVVEGDEVESRVADAHRRVDRHPAVVLTVDQVAASLV